jgi:hypothetical protein
VPDLPPEIVVTDLPDGVRFTLPRRQLGAVRMVGLFPVAVGLVMTGFCVAWVVHMLSGLGGLARADALIGGLMVAAIGVPTVLSGLAVVGLGVFILTGHSTVEVSGGRLRAVEHAGPLWWRRSRRVEQVRRFTVTQTDRREEHQDPLAGVGAAAGLSTIVAECDPGGRMWLAPGYPRAWLRPFAEELARRCQTTTEAGTLTAAPAVSERVDPVFTPTRQQTVTAQPAGSRAVVDEDAAGLTITLPPAGLGKGTKGLFAFAVLWCLITAGVTAGFAVGFGNGQVDDGLWIVALVLAVFWLVGVGLLLGGYQMGRRRAVLAVVGGRLLVLQSGPLGSKRREWPREDVARIAVGPSGMEVNEVPVLELQIQPKCGRKVGLLAGRDEAELHWLATRLRRALTSQ